MQTTDITTGQQHILAPLCQQWLRQIKEAKKHKWDKFGQYAAEGMKFYDGVHNWMWDDEQKNVKGFLEKGVALPKFRMQVNRVFEAVALFGPALYHRNPHISVKPIDPPFIAPESLGVTQDNPQTAQVYQQLVSQQQSAVMQRETKAKLSQHYLNWLQTETDKKMNARRSITEALIKGMGVLETAIFQPRGSQIKYPYSVHRSIDDIVLDPDAEYWDDIQYMAQYCCHPVNLVERTYNLPPGTLKGHIESNKSQGQTYGSTRQTAKRKRDGRTFDLIEYWKIYSKNGFGDQLRKTSDGQKMSENLNFEIFGDFCKIVVSEGIPFPLNLPTEALSQETPEDIMKRVEWDVPYWTSGGWPFTFLSFYDKPRSVWPVSLIKPAVGELRFVNWCMSFLAQKTAASCTTYVGQAKAAGVEIQNQIQNNMAPYTVLEISEMTGRKVDDVISFLQAPEFNVDIWTMLAEVLEMIDKRTGLTDLIYGMTDKQLRSATEADIKESNTNIRPDDMAGRVEDFLSETALNEIAACVWACEAEDVEPVLGQLGAAIFGQSIKTEEFERIIRDYDYRIAAGSARKPNKQTRLRALNELGQSIVPTLQEFAMQGIVEPWNAYVGEVAETLDLDASDFLIQLPEEEEGPSDEEKAAQMDMQMKQMEMQMKQAELQMKQRESEQQAALKEEQAESELDRKEEEHAMEMRQDAEMHRQEMRQAEEEAEQNILQEKAELAMMSKEQQLKLEGLRKMQQAQLAAKRAQARAAAEGNSSDSQSS